MPERVEKDFPNRLSEAFDDASMAVIARRLGVPHATVRNYFNGRMPSPEVLIKIARETNVSLNWLLTGTGEKLVRYERAVDIGRALEDKIGQIVDEKLAERFDGAGASKNSKPSRSAPRKEPGQTRFDVASAVRRLNDPQLVMSEWFRHDGLKYPKDLGLIFFRGWESFSSEEKLDAVMDARKVLDRTLHRK